MSQQILNNKTQIMINGYLINFNSSKDLLVYLLLNIPDLLYSPLDILKENILNIFSIVSEYAKEIKDPARNIRISSKQQLQWKATKTKEELQIKVYDLILSLEGMNSLHGFGFANKFGDKLLGNSEKRRSHNES